MARVPAAFGGVVAALVALLLAPVTAATALAHDARGLAFVSTDALCRYHCSPTHAAHFYRELRATSECESSRCAGFRADQRRRLEEAAATGAAASTAQDRSYTFGDGAAAEGGVVHANPHNAAPGPTPAASKSVQVVDFVTCQGLSDAAAERHTVSLALGADASAFAGFYKAFFAAYDAMLGTTEASGACRLQFVQDALLANASALNDDHDAPAEQLKRRPMLIRLDATGPDTDERACVDAIRDIWTPEDEGFTPFLTRRDQNEGATVMLMHLGRDVADRLAKLNCVASVTALPAVLKLTPFARASVALAREDKPAQAGPALEIRLVQGTDAQGVLDRLQGKIASAIGVTNALSKATKRVVHLRELDEFRAWAQAVALILDDDAVEWVDLRTELRASVLGPGESFEQRLWATFDRDEFQLRRPQHRRLDAFVQDLVGAKEVRAKQITGRDIVVGVTDTGLYMDHDQFDQPARDIYDQTDLGARKVVLYRAFGNKGDESENVVCGHGTHVSGILAGSSLSNQSENLGIASSARIAFMDIGRQAPACVGQRGCEVKLETPGEVETLMKDQVDAGAKIFSFSWGTGGNDYNAQSRDLDNYIYNNPEILIIVAAGNSGDKGERTISSPSGAKNVISVGASLNDAASFVKTPCSSVLNKNTVASFSSIGPTLDGRLKPDLVAPGMAIESSQSEPPGSTVKSTALCSLQGTSQATPVVAGMAVLLYEWLRDGWWKGGVRDPKYGMKVIPASLLKALIIHSGERMTRRLVAPRNGVTSCVAMEANAQVLENYPDFNQGYGKPTMANLVSFLDDQGAGVYFFPNSTEGSEPRVTEGSAARFTFMLKERANLRVTLVWTDPAGSMGGRQALQNDLDLSVRVPNTDKVFYPLSGNGTRDSRNNVEMVEVSYDEIVTLLKASDPNFKVANGVMVEAVVLGRSVKAGSRSGQTFALVASSSPSSVETTMRSENKSSFWQPWMTVGIVVGGTLLILFVIAIAWRFKHSASKDLKTPVTRTPTRHAHPGRHDNYHGAAPPPRRGGAPGRPGSARPHLQPAPRRPQQAPPPVPQPQRA